MTARVTIARFTGSVSLDSRRANFCDSNRYSTGFEQRNLAKYDKETA